jgi:hypothetical protein
MCEPVTLTAIAIGASVGAASSAATGGDPLMGALIGGATGAFMPGGVGVTGGSASGLSGMVGSAAGPTFVTGLGADIALSGVAQAAGVGLLGGKLLNPMLNPQTPDYSGYTPASYQVQQQQFNSQQIATTGSGGRQATASLAEAIQRSKQRKLSQADVGDLSIDTSAFASTGLQLA